MRLPVVAVGAVLLVSLLSGCGGGAASPSQVAGAAGATMCDNSGFYVQSKLTNEKQVIYDCRFAAKLPKCVTYSGNIADNATVEVQLLFSQSLNSKKPACLAWVKAAQERLAAARRLKRERAYLHALIRTRREAWHRGYAAYLNGVGAYQLPNVYYKWLPPSCSAYIPTCFTIEVVTRHGCPSALSIEVEVHRGGTQIGTAYGNAGSLRPYTPAVVEVDSMDQGASSLTGYVGSITCF